MEAVLLGCGEDIVTLLWKFSLGLIVVVAFPLGRRKLEVSNSIFFLLAICLFLQNV